MAAAPRSEVVRSGVVAAFDPAAGLGVVADERDRWQFHCTQLCGGVRVIPVGTKVEFVVRTGLPGVWEARSVRGAAGTYLCPVCGNSVAGSEGSYEICECCGWEDDPVQRDDPDAEGSNTKTLRASRDHWIRTLISGQTGAPQEFARG